jgi:hypothetical protein
MSEANTDVLSGKHERSIVNLDGAQLSALRWQLQTEIYSHVREKKSRNNIEAKKTIYNQVVDALHDRQTHLQADPMEKLPHELVLNIFAEIAPHIRYSDTVGSIQDLLCLTMVSKKWRNFILSEPLLWTHLTLDPERYDNFAAISLQLRLSNPLPLTVEAYLDFEQWDTLRPMLLQSSDRIETVLIHGFRLHSSHGEYARENYLLNFLEKLGLLSNLRHLAGGWITYGRPFSIKGFLDRYLSLNQVTGIPLSIQDLQNAKDRLNIKSLTTYDDVKTVLPIIESIGSLKKVGLSASSSPPRPRREETEAEGSGNESISTHQLGWTNLSYGAYDSRSLVPLLHRLSSLSDLNIQLILGTNFLETVATRLHQLEHLKSLSIHFNIMTGDTIRAPSDLSPNCSVRSLRILIDTIMSGPYELNDRKPKETAYKSSEVIVTTLLDITPKVAKLNLWLGGSQTFPLSCLEKYFTGNDLSLCLRPDTTEKSRKLFVPPSVQKVTLSGGINISRSLTSQFVKTLEVYEYYPSKYEEVTDIGMELNLEDWVALEEIYLHRRPVAWNKFSLPFLKKVSINMKKGGDRALAIHGITAFIKELACRPGSYPSLEEIELNECPEWDILMIMLERRNLLQGSGIKKIRTIKLGSPCSLEIQRIISGLLAGKWTERPSNRDLSLAGNAEVLLDLSL